MHNLKHYLFVGLEHLEKIEHLRGQLRSLWQADIKSTANYYERLKSLISEIDPQTSPDYIKHKFLQKLRKDILNKLRLGQSSSLSDLLHDAIETESNIIQRKFDDKLRATHNTNVSSSTTVNHLHGTSPFFPSSSTNNNEQVKSDNRNYSIHNRSNPTHHAGNRHSRTFTNSSASFQLTYIQHESQKFRQNYNRNTKAQSTNNHRWCSFCSSSSHSWSYCYSNPDNCRYNSSYNQCGPPQYYQQQLPQPSYQQHSSPQHYPPQPQHQYYQQSSIQRYQPSPQQQQRHDQQHLQTRNKLYPTSHSSSSKNI